MRFGSPVPAFTAVSSADRGRDGSRKARGPCVGKTSSRLAAKQSGCSACLVSGRARIQIDDPCKQRPQKDRATERG